MQNLRYLKASDGKSQEEGYNRANKMKYQARQKEQAQLKEQPDKVLVKVPEEYIFWCHGGRRRQGYKCFAEGLMAISDDIVAFHVNSERKIP